MWSVLTTLQSLSSYIFRRASCGVKLNMLCLQAKLDERKAYMTPEPDDVTLDAMGTEDNVKLDVS